MESSSLHNMLRNIYGYSEIEKNKQIVYTDLQFTTYMQLKFKEIATYVVPSGLVSKDASKTLCKWT